MSDQRKTKSNGQHAWLISSVFLCVVEDKMNVHFPPVLHGDIIYLLTGLLFSGCPEGCGRCRCSYGGGSCWCCDDVSWAVWCRCWSGMWPHRWSPRCLWTTTPQPWARPRWHNGGWPLFCHQTQLWISPLAGIWLDFLEEIRFLFTH